MKSSSKVKTACPLDCWDTCSIIADVEDGRVIRLEGDPNHPVTQGTLCGKGRRLKDRLYEPSRILHPMKKVQGAWQSISWDQAYTEIAEKIQMTLRHSGHHAILHAYDWGSGTVLKNLNQRFFYLMGGCTETVGSLCWDAGLEAQRYDFGQARSHAPLDTPNANAVVVWGRNVAVTNMHMMPYIKQAQANGAKLVVINPLSTDLERRADLVIHPRPGTDGLLALGTLKVCMEQNMLDTTFITQHSIGWDSLQAYLNTLSLEDVSRETDVSVHDIQALATVYGEIHPVTTLLGIGLQRHAGGGHTIRSIDALAAATGHVGVKGGGINYANRWIPEFLDQEALTARETANVREFTRGGQADEILNATPPIELMFVTRTNTVTQVPDTAKLLKAYETIACTVVMDMFMTPTAELADYFLPCTSVLEEEDFVFSTMWHPNITYIQKAVEPQGEAKPDWMIFAELADHLGFGDQMRKPLDEWFQAVLAPLASYGLNLDVLKERGTIQIPVADIPWYDYQFRTPSGKFEFSSNVAAAEGHSPHAVYVRPLEASRNRVMDRPVGAYPYALLTVHPRLSENSQHRLFPNVPDVPVVEVSGRISLEKQLVPDGLARVWNDQAEVIAKVKVVPEMHDFTVKLESGWWGQGVTANHFTRSYQADFGQQTAQYDCTCDIEPVEQ